MPIKKDQEKANVSEGFLSEVERTENQKKEMDQVLACSQFKGSNRDSFMDINAIDSIHEEVCNKYHLPNNSAAIAVIGVLCQLGGTSAGCDGNLTANIDLFDDENMPIKVKARLKDIKVIFANNNQKNKLRKYAKTMSDTILPIVKHYQIHGNLAKKIQRMFISNPDVQFTNDQLVELSDFFVDSNLIHPDSNFYIKQSFAMQSTQKRSQGKKPNPKKKSKRKK